MDCERMCAVCRKHFDKRQLVRVVKDKSGLVEVDISGKKNGRGAYVCSKDCMEKCKKSRLLNRAFKCEVDNTVYDNLINHFKDKSE